MWIIIFWLIIGMSGLIENAELIAGLEDKKLRFLGMFIIVLSMPIRIIAGIFDYLLEEIFGEEFDDNGPGTC